MKKTLVEKMNACKNKGFIKYLFLLLIFLFLLNTALLKAYVPMYLYRPDSKTMQQIYWIYYTYGYSNKSIIVPIYNPPSKSLEFKSSSNVIGWSRGYIGDSVYIGSIFDLIEGKPDIFKHSFNITQKEIILASALYKISSFEYLFCEKISDIGIYRFTLNNINELEFALIHTAYWIDYGFKGKWGIRTNTLNVSVNANNPNYTSIRIPQNINGSGWFTIEYLMDNIPALNISTLIIMIAGTLNTSWLTIEVYNPKYAFTGKKIHTLNTTHYWVILPLREGEILQKIRFSIYNNGTRSSVSEYLNISYLALI